ncbi:MAG: hypothetical protein K9J12_05790 [Melioribacteraceae bacterium]|nr:hypothetical protein [Melioribacteraceae bacterium]MCF8264955.1 hypothetical protein [Melioribacteraceae bacterium]MCF8413783.1 hypothetical protein [Melioribacteraceae bacterium]MCF8431971.1 hypothetical protein [Melioribacteraceae bacterium]
MATTNSNGNQPKTGFGRYMVYTFIPRYANNVNGIVYMGAAILIIIVGLRGLGSIAGEIAIVPRFLIGDDNKVLPTYVMGALFLEFFLLFIMAIVTFFTPEDEPHQAGGASHGGSGEEAAVARTLAKFESPDYEKELARLKKLTDEEVQMIETYLDKFDEISKKIFEIQKSNVEALSKMAQSLKQ